MDIRSTSAALLHDDQKSSGTTAGMAQISGTLAASKVCLEVLLSAPETLPYMSSDQKCLCGIRVMPLERCTWSTHFELLAPQSTNVIFVICMRDGRQDCRRAQCSFPQTCHSQIAASCTPGIFLTMYKDAGQMLSSTPLKSSSGVLRIPFKLPV